jgi:hypothetical protein
MEFGSIIDVIAGMLFVYLLLSLLCTAIGEYIEAKLNNRAKLLKRGIELLLNESKGGGIDLAGRLYEHGLIRPLYRDANQLPSYIPSRTFAMALWNMATATAAGGGVTNDSAMDRVSGWYKRRAAFTMLALGVGMAAVLNADSINIATALSRDSTLRETVVAAAQERIDAAPEAADQAAAPSADAEAAYADVASLGLPIGWVWTPANDNDLRQLPGSAGGWLLKLLGILLTGFAVSQGAPFWFDLLNKFMVIRSTVKPKEKSREEGAK